MTKRYVAIAETYELYGSYVREFRDESVGGAGANCVREEFARKVGHHGVRSMGA